ncbi:hypothetical protein evm_001230 [Chilo suppressalis]|nr:hypothetical protein evm_001230 [Chilo suppressalis]
MQLHLNRAEQLVETPEYCVCGIRKDAFDSRQLAQFDMALFRSAILPVNRNSDSNQIKIEPHRGNPPLFRKRKT